MAEEIIEEMEDDGIIELVGEDGKSERFFHLATIEYEGGTYGVFELAEPETDEEAEMGFVFSMVEDGDDVVMDEVDDDELADKIFQIYLEQYEGYDEE